MYSSLSFHPEGEGDDKLEKARQMLVINNMYTHNYCSPFPYYLDASSPFLAANLFRNSVKGAPNVLSPNPLRLQSPGL